MLTLSTINSLLIARLHDLLSMDADHVSLASIDYFVDSLSNSIMSAFDIVAPARAIRVSSRRKPWINLDLRKLMRLRDNLYRAAKATNSPVLFQRYKSRSEINNTLDTCKNSYLQQLLSDSADAAALWSNLRKLGVCDDKRPLLTDVFTTNALNKHFVRIASTAPPLTPCFLSDITMDIIPDEGCSEFALSSIQIPSIYHTLKHSSSSVGCDGISFCILRLAQSALLQPLCDLFNVSLTSDYFLIMWKTARIIPLSKFFKLTSLSDTRSIAILPELSKLFKCIVHNQLSLYIKRHGLLNLKQSGYRRVHSSQTALIRVLDDMRLVIDQRKLTIILLFDFSKAFDTVPHQRLLQKLHLLRCSPQAVKWFYSYLLNRSQFVSNPDGTRSNTLRTTSGVPQGSVLGPLLFSIFINNISSVLIHSNFMLFADDF